jgi:hypothetical protein
MASGFPKTMASSFVIVQSRAGVNQGQTATTRFAPPNSSEQTQQLTSASRLHG